MKTVHFGFGSMDRDTHLDVKRSVLKNAFAMICPAFLCCLVIACAILQPYSAASQPTNGLFSPSANDTASSTDTCEFGDASCILRQSEMQVEQAKFLTRQYPLILRNTQVLEARRASLGERPTPKAASSLDELRMRVRIMTVLYNAHASRTDPSLLSERHLPTKLSM